ncbi:Imm21 family immunity protein [Flavilitoribacter nigricans]|nr:Imm21 family immunity protein [Flavilitoribacter nigricans]
MNKRARKLKWIGSLGGPSVIIGAPLLKLWSGIGSVEGAGRGEYEEVEDSMDPQQSHYGLACSVEDPIASVRIAEGGDAVIVIGDLPDLMTVIGESRYGNKIIAKWDYGDSTEEFESFLDYERLNQLNGWTINFDIQLEDRKFYLLDATVSGFDLFGQDVIIFYLQPGHYQVSTLQYQPNDRTSMLLHRIRRN